MLELYHFAFSTCSQKVRLVLEEKGLEFTSHEVNLIAGEQHSPALTHPLRAGRHPAVANAGSGTLSRIGRSCQPPGRPLTPGQTRVAVLRAASARMWQKHARAGTIRTPVPRDAEVSWLTPLNSISSAEIPDGNPITSSTVVPLVVAISGI